MSHDEAASTESKTEVPRFDGEASKLAEYQFRVRLKQARERNITDTKKKKWGPLAIRLIDGLRGPALQVARNLKIDKLEEADGGVQYLLSSLQAALQPRSKQEARELYQVGAQQGGVLSRQQGEPIPSYVLRRKAWYSMMLDLDNELRLPEGILAEQLLQNAGISADHMLLIRTAIQSDMTWDKVCEELVAQHSRIHEKEIKGGKSFGKGDRSFAFKGGGKNYGKNFGKRKGGWRAYHVEDDGEYYGDENWENASQSLGGYEDYDQVSYWSSEGSPHHHDHYEMDEEDTMYSAFQAMVDEGLDESNQEAVDYAAEVLQAESEVYWARQKAFGTGHKGFWSGTRDFKVQGSLTLEEKKARIQALKSKTQCRKCGQYGHWGDDPSCPRNSKKGGKKGGSPGSTASTSGGKSSGKSKSPEKSRNVYFTINEYEADRGGPSGSAYMVQKTYNAVPPPECLQDGVGAPGAAAADSSSSQHPIPMDERSADDVMDELIAEAERRTDKRKKNMLKEEASETFEQHLTSMKKEEELRRMEHLDLDRFMAVVNDPEDPEWRDAYNERWNEFVPGHPLFCDEDKKRIQRWAEKARLGLPRIPADQSIEDKKGEGSQRACNHENVTRQGSNGYWKILKRRDCGKILEKEKVKKDETMKKEEGECQHLEKDFRGTTGTTWRWKCKACGKVESGVKRGGESGYQASQAGEGPDGMEAEAVSRIIDMMRYTVEMQQELGFRVSVEQLDKIYYKCRDLVIGGSSLSKSSTLTTTRANIQKGSQAPRPRGFTKEELVEFRSRVLGSGVHKGRTFRAIYEKEKTYVKSIVTKYQSGNLKDSQLCELASYFIQEDDGGSVALMAGLDEGQEDREDEVVAVLDTGCNNTCHGDGWMRKFVRITGTEPVEEPAEGGFRGVGGKVEVSCKRTPHGDEGPQW